MRKTTRYTFRMKTRAFFRGMKRLRPLVEVAVQGLKLYEGLQDLNARESREMQRYLDGIRGSPSFTEISEILSERRWTDGVQESLVGALDSMCKTVRAVHANDVPILTDTPAYGSMTTMPITRLSMMWPHPAIIKIRAREAIESGNVTSEPARSRLQAIASQE